MSKYKEIPIPLGWKVIIEPKKGKTVSEGGIDVSATRQAQEHLVYMGTILAMGESAFTAETKGGINMNGWKVRPQVGDVVIYSPYGGMQLRPSGCSNFLLLMNDTDIHAIIDDESSFYSWIDV
jgi:co-chaperonin GroES (HSP10)